MYVVNLPEIPCDFAVILYCRVIVLREIAVCIYSSFASFPGTYAPPGQPEVASSASFRSSLTLVVASIASSFSCSSSASSFSHSPRLPSSPLRPNALLRCHCHRRSFPWRLPTGCNDTFLIYQAAPPPSWAGATFRPTTTSLLTPTARCLSPTCPMMRTA